MKAIFFDLDGTLVDSLPGIEFAVDSALAGMHLVRTQPLRPLIGPPIRTILQSVAGGATERQLDGLEMAFRATYDSAGWRQTAAQAGTVEMLDRLRAAGMALFLVTNKPLDASEKILRMLGLRDYFQDVLARDSVRPNFASKALMLRWLLERHALAPDKCMMVGDTGEDARAATAAGMPSVLMAHGYGEYESTARPGCRVLKDFSELTVAQAVEPAEPRFVSALLVELDHADRAEGLYDRP